MKEPVFIIMAKLPAVGQTKTRLCPPLTCEQSAALYEALLRDTITLVTLVPSARLAVAVTPPEATADFRHFAPQHALLLPVAGAHIGDCLSQALARTLTDGHPKALAVNSDGPTLPADYLHQALLALEGVDVVVGPSEDGGYYLIGLKQHYPQLFEGIAWSTAQVTDQTLARAEALGLSVALLPPWYDVDTAADLERLRAELDHLPPESLPHTRRLLSSLPTTPSSSRTACPRALPEAPPEPAEGK